MQAEVWLDDKCVGTIDWQFDHWGVQVTLDCAAPADRLRLLRCYGQTAAGALLIGLPEPKRGRLQLSRHLSAQTLREAGCATGEMPVRFYLSDSGPLPRTEEHDNASAAALRQAERAIPVQTGDAVLDALLREHTVAVDCADGRFTLSCPFAPDRPFALAPAFSLCCVADATAILTLPSDLPSRAAASLDAAAGENAKAGAVPQHD